jgi:hypothetical protein
MRPYKLAGDVTPCSPRDEPAWKSPRYTSDRSQLGELLPALTIDFLAMSYAQNQDDQAVVFNLADKPVIAHAIFPKLPKS